MAQELLNGADIVPVFEQVGRELVAERVAVDRLLDVGVAHRLSEGPLDDALVQVMTPLDLRPRVDTAFGREEPLPAPVPLGRGVFFRDSVRNVNGAETVSQVPLMKPPDARRVTRRAPDERTPGRGTGRSLPPLASRTLIRWKANSGKLG